MKKSDKEGQYFKLNMPRLLIGIVLIFFIWITIRQELQINKLKSNLIRVQNSTQQLENNVDDLDRKNSDLEDRINDLESSVDDLESNQNY